MKCERGTKDLGGTWGRDAPHAKPYVTRRQTAAHQPAFKASRMGLPVNQGRNYRGPFTATLDVTRRMGIPVRQFGRLIFLLHLQALQIPNNFFMTRKHS